MTVKTEKKLLKNCLFLICPTDNIEFVLANSVTGQAFFYTSLGACFEWDATTQEEIATVIKKNSINQVAIVLKMNNRFFTEKLKVKFNLATYPVEKALQRVEDGLSENIKYWETTAPKLKALAAQYLDKQKNRLLKPQHLGQLLKERNIEIASLIAINKGQLIKTETLKRSTDLLETISVN